ncbi:MAG: Uma2 family endonuclease [Anaerolineae bacterium]|nr:Uma2 family endonuclease [Anaerolineae bacterium]
MAAVLQADIVAAEVSFDEYMEKYAAEFCEWFDGVVVKMSPVSDVHNIITLFLINFFSTYFELRPIGLLRQVPFVLKITPDGPAREPDLQIILNEHAEWVKPTRVEGKADIVIEVVSEESTERDYGQKFVEYEAGGIPEYWIVDPLRHETRFYRLSGEGRYASQMLNASGEYETPLLPGLHVPVNWLWQPTPPGPIAIAQYMQAWLV